jgi:hypothetical protein
VRTDAFVARDLFRRQPARDEPEDLDLPVSDRKARARPFEQDAPRYRPSDERTDGEPRGSADIHGGTSGRGLRGPRSGQLARFSVRRSLERITSCSKRSRNSCPPQRGQSG